MGSLGDRENLMNDSVVVTGFLLSLLIPDDE